MFFSCFVIIITRKEKKRKEKEKKNNNNNNNKKKNKMIKWLHIDFNKMKVKKGKDKEYNSIEYETEKIEGRDYVIEIIHRIIETAEKNKPLKLNYKTRKEKKIIRIINDAPVYECYDRSEINAIKDNEKERRRLKMIRDLLR